MPTLAFSKKSLGNIAHDQHAAGHPSVAVPDRGGRVLDRPLDAVAGAQHDVVAERRHRPPGQRLAHRIRHDGARLLVDDVEDPLDRLSERVGGPPTGQPLDHAVHHRHPAFEVGRDHAVADRGERGAERVALLEELALGGPHPAVEEGDDDADHGEPHQVDAVLEGQVHRVHAGRGHHRADDQGKDERGDAAPDAAEVHRHHHRRIEGEETDLLAADRAEEGSRRSPRRNAQGGDQIIPGGRTDAIRHRRPVWGIVPRDPGGSPRPCRNADAVTLSESDPCAVL
jgi:hypothetical protein